MKQERPTLKDIAKRASVSESAASLALAGKPGVSEKTRTRILTIAQELEWTPNYAARVLSGAPAETIGLVIARDTEDFGSESFFLRFLAGVQSALSEVSYGLLLQTVDSIDDEIAAYRRWNTANRVDGLVLLDMRVDDRRVSEVEKLRLPAVVVGTHVDSSTMCSIETDDDGVMKSVAQYLADLGHARIAYVAGNEKVQHIRDRASALQRFGVTNDIDTFVAYTDSSAEQATTAIVDAVLPWNPSVIVFDNEVTALAGIHSLRAAKKNIPSDISILVWEDSASLALVDPPLTTLERDPFVLGDVAARLLLSVLRGSKRRVLVQEIPSIVVRESVADLSTGPK